MVGAVQVKTTQVAIILDLIYSKRVRWLYFILFLILQQSLHYWS